MFSYRCPSCGASAYSSAGAATVGPCPHCAQSLGQPAGESHHAVVEADVRSDLAVDTFVLDARPGIVR
jgi:ribosomal protein S27E